MPGSGVVPFSSYVLVKASLPESTLADSSAPDCVTETTTVFLDES